MSDFSWVCQYCGQPTTVTSPNYDSESHVVDIEKEKIAFGSHLSYRGKVIACPNPDCKQISFEIALNAAYRDQFGRWQTSGNLHRWELLPESSAKPQPDYIPTQIVNDYIEACRIKGLSPKASATLSRRCLQGMIRDFWGIKVKSGKLADEIKELEGRVSQAEWDAIDAVRSVGNVGAHMVRDVNVIIDVEPQEAMLLIQLIEDCFKNWYVVRHDREERQKRLITLARGKKAAKKSGTDGK